MNPFEEYPRNGDIKKREKNRQAKHRNIFLLVQKQHTSGTGELKIERTKEERIVEHIHSIGKAKVQVKK